MGDVTHVLEAIDQGDPQAAEELLPIVYNELRRLAAQKLSQEKPGQTLQATALVHEAYLRLIGSENRQWDGRGHFFAAAAEAMRRILVDTARRKQARKHGGGQQRIDLDDLQISNDVSPHPEDMIALDEALSKLASEDPVKGEVVKLRYFAGLSLRQISETLGISPSTADNYWAYARCWLRLEMSGEVEESERLRESRR